MHELTITRNIIAIVSEYAQGAKVKRVLLEIGQLSAIMSDAVHFCFDVCSQGTVLEETKLEIIEIAGLGKCCQCGTEIPLIQPFGKCLCGSTQLNLIAGEELKIKEIEVE